MIVASIVPSLALCAAPPQAVRECRVLLSDLTVRDIQWIRIAVSSPRVKGDGIWYLDESRQERFLDSRSFVAIVPTGFGQPQRAWAAGVEASQEVLSPQPTPAFKSGQGNAGAQDNGVPPPTSAAGLVKSRIGPATTLVWGVLETADGQRFFGEVDGEAPAAQDCVLWKSRELGGFSAPLESISRLVPSYGSGSQAWPPPLSAAASTDDVIILRNSDTLTGFVESISREVVVTGVATGDAAGQGSEIRLPLSDVAEIRFAGESGDAGGVHGARLWLRDGVVASVKSVMQTTDGRRCIAALADPMKSAAGDDAVQFSFGMSEVTALMLDLAAVRPLSSCGIPVVSAGISTEGPASGGFASECVTSAPAPYAPLGAGDVLISEPCAVRWMLPRGAQRIAGLLEMPESCWDWGDCLVRLEADGNILFESALNAQKPEAAFNVEIRGQEAPIQFHIVVEAAANGPIQDQVIVRAPLVLLAEAASSAP